MPSATPGKESENGVYEFPYMRPQSNQSKWERIQQTIWDSDSGKFLGRNAKSWAQILTFYFVFYVVLAALFALCMQGLFLTLDDSKPRWLLDQSIIGTNPGLGFRPISNRTEEGSLIWYNAKNETSIKKWTDLIDSYLELYLDSSKLPGGGRNQEVCHFDKVPSPGKVCSVDVSKWGPCSREKNYGYSSSSPCFFLKLNRIYGWKAEYYNDINSLPDEMPEDLKDHIRNLNPAKIYGWKAEYYNDINFLPDEMPEDLKDHIRNLNPAKRNQIWVSCQGENPADRENIFLNLTYHPQRGFPHYYYPYTNLEGYLSPLVAVQVPHPSSHILVNIECRAWAKNIIYRGGNQQREGSVHLEIMVD